MAATTGARRSPRNTRSAVAWLKWVAVTGDIETCAAASAGAQSRANRLDQWHPVFTAGPSTVFDLLEGPLRVRDQPPQRSAAVCTGASHN
jgi:hypothetical protein